MKNIFILLFFMSIGSNIFSQEDHSELVEGPFETPQEVTETCLMCHEGIDEDIIRTITRRINGGSNHGIDYLNHWLRIGDNRA